MAAGMARFFYGANKIVAMVLCLALPAAEFFDTPLGRIPVDQNAVRELAALSQVVASAPLEGFLHRTNVLDTLGDDQQETPCKLNR